MRRAGGIRSEGSHVLRRCAFGLALALAPSCSILPSEFNVSPVYRHRLDENGAVLEMDVLWPIFHFETLADGGTDFRVRPFYRRVERPAKPGFGVGSDDPDRRDHQFLWPLGRVRESDREWHGRLWPLWNHDHRRFEDGREETDFYFLFPFFWGGYDKAGPDAPARPYFGMFPLYLDTPREFLTYDRLTFVLWPLYTRTKKDGRTGHTFLWPFLGFGSVDEEERRERGLLDQPQTTWVRVLPLFNYIAREGDWWRLSLLWPVFSYGVDLLYTDDPLFSFHVFPLFGWQSNETITGWSFLWPFFRGHEVEGKSRKLQFFWPVFHYFWSNLNDENLETWWVWPLVSRTTSRYQRAWTFLWPLSWFREYDDSDGLQKQHWVLPFYKWIHRDRKAWRDQGGGVDDYLQIWPLLHVESEHTGEAEWAFPSPWPYRADNAEGVHELYGWLYTLLDGRTRQTGDRAVKTWAHLYSTRTRGARSQTSVPFLFSHESDGDRGTFYLFNLIPFSYGRGAR